MSIKIYISGNYFVIDDGNLPLKKGHSKNVIADNNGVDANLFYFENVKGWNGSKGVSVTEIQNEAGVVYTLAAFSEFCEERTGNNIGGDNGEGVVYDDSLLVARTSHVVYKVASILETNYATIELAAQALAPFVQGSAAFPLDALGGIYEISATGEFVKLTDYFEGLQVVDNSDDKHKKWDTANAEWDTTLENFSKNYGELQNTPFIDFAFAGNEIPVVFIFGQSNADGRGNLTDLPGTDVSFPNNEVRIWNKPITRNPANATVNRNDNGSWKDYAIGDMVTSPQGASATAFGPELAIAMRWRDELFEKTGKQLHINKCCVGGTTLADGSVDNSWSDTDDSLRELAVNYFAMPAIRQLQLNGLTPKCLGVIWGQGESDTNSATNANNYVQNLRDFFPDIKQKIGFPDATVSVMGLSNHSTSANWNTVKQAQIDYCNEEASANLIRTDGSGDELPIATYINGVGAGTIHYSSQGLMALGDLYFDNLNFYGNEYAEPWDYAFIGSAEPIGASIRNTDFTVFSNYGSPEFVQYPTSTGNANAITFVRSGHTLARPNINTEPAPMFIINAMDDHSDAEVIFRMIHDGNTDTKPGVMFRSETPLENSTSWNNYLTQVRLGGNQLTMFKNTGGWVALDGSPATPSQAPNTSDPYWYRITWIGNRIRVYNSPDGRTWTQQFTDTDDTYQSGGMIFTLYNGKCDKSIGNLRVAHCAFDVLIARKL